MVNRYEILPESPLDPIMQANTAWPAFKAARPDAVNATIGVLVDGASGEIWRPGSVQKARIDTADDIDLFVNYGYQTPKGNDSFLCSAREFVFSLDAPSKDILSYQSLGGTGALSLINDTLAQLLKEGSEGRQLLIDPGWPNHSAIFQSNFTISTYNHTDENGYNHAGAIRAVEELPDNSTVLFQVNGYNDDGLDRTQAQWDEILELAKSKGHIVILDAAYLGLTDEITKDTYPIKKAEETGLFTFVSVSMSKNMGLYNERLGALFVVNADDHLGRAQADNLDQVIKKNVRRTISSTPLLVAEAAAKVLQGTDVDCDFQDEFFEARKDLDDRRDRLAEIIGDRLPNVSRGRGLFTKLLPEGFTPTQRESLQEDGILVLPNSRINIGGLQHDQIEKVGSAILRALN